MLWALIRRGDSNEHHNIVYMEKYAKLSLNYPQIPSLSVPLTSVLIMAQYMSGRGGNAGQGNVS